MQFILRTLLDLGQNSNLNFLEYILSTKNLADALSSKNYSYLDISTIIKRWQFLIVGLCRDRSRWVPKDFSRTLIRFFKYTCQFGQLLASLSHPPFPYQDFDLDLPQELCKKLVWVEAQIKPFQIVPISVIDNILVGKLISLQRRHNRVM